MEFGSAGDGAMGEIEEGDMGETGEGEIVGGMGETGAGEGDGVPCLLRHQNQYKRNSPSNMTTKMTPNITDLFIYIQLHDIIKNSVIALIMMTNIPTSFLIKRVQFHRNGSCAKKVVWRIV